MSFGLHRTQTHIVGYAYSLLVNGEKVVKCFGKRDAGKVKARYERFGNSVLLVSEPVELVKL